MSKTIETTVEIDLDEFTDEEIWKEVQVRGLGLREGNEVADLAHAIEREDKAEALACLLAIIRGSPMLVEAMERGRRRRS